MPNQNLLDCIFVRPESNTEPILKSYSVMFSVHIEIAMLASPVNHSVNLRTVNNMGLHITPSHYSIGKCIIYAQ